MYEELKPPSRLLMGPGPSNVHPRVLKAMATPLVGHLDPYFLEVLERTSDLLRMVFNTKNEFTIAISGTGSAGMETCLCSITEPGDEIIVGVKGTFGERMVDIVRRLGGKPIIVEQERGKIIEPGQIKRTLDESNAKAVAIVHAETSTGVLQPLDGIGDIVRKYDALFIVDAVTSLGGAPVNVDERKIDICYSGTQKCLNCPPGLSPLTISERAWTVIEKRKTPITSWYLDVTMLKRYWGKERWYHHTAPVSMIYALYEALRIIEEEGLESRFEKHKVTGEAVRESMKALGLDLFAQEGYETPMLTSIKIPDGIDDRTFRKTLLTKHNVEIAGGLDLLKGKIWRIGHMGYGTQPAFVLPTLTAVEKTLRDLGRDIEPGTAASTALQVLEKL